jgi:hypothetical protein
MAIFKQKIQKIRRTVSLLIAEQTVSPETNL